MNIKHKCIRNKNGGYIMRNNKIYYVYNNINRRRDVSGLEKVEVKISFHQKRKRIQRMISLCIVLLMLTAFGVHILLSYFSDAVNTSTEYGLIEEISGKNELKQINAIDDSIDSILYAKNELIEITPPPVTEIEEEEDIYEEIYEEEIYNAEYHIDEPEVDEENIEVNDSYESIECVAYTMENTEIDLGSTKLKQLNLPNVYYGDIDFSSFQPFEAYTDIKNKNSPSYQICHGENSYTDGNGFRRHKVSEEEFSINGEDDYIVALGTFYKTKGTAGERFMVETTTGAYTIITGDEKADCDTDDMHMFRMHGNGKAGMIEYIIDKSCLNSEIKRHGTATAGPVVAIQGEITAIYKIE